MARSEHGPEGPTEGPFGPDDPEQQTASNLPERDREILDFERHAWRRSGPKEAAIRSEVGLSSTRYYQLLNELIDTREAYEYDPLLVLRLRQRREDRRRRRIVGREVDPRRR